MGRFRIHAPVADHSGVVAGVGFHAGVGETTDPGRGALQYFASAGYRIEPLVDDPADVDPADDPRQPADVGEDGDDNPGPQPGDPSPLPTRSASRAKWVAYAVTTGGVDQAEAAAMSRDQLAERFHGAGEQG